MLFLFSRRDRFECIEDADGKPKRVLNKRETMLAQQKQQVIKDAFANWVWQDPQRRIALVKQYNELFNSTRPREYDGSHIHFVGMNPEITLREHQRNAIAHVLYARPLIILIRELPGTFCASGISRFLRILIYSLPEYPLLIHRRTLLWTS